MRSPLARLRDRGSGTVATVGLAAAIFGAALLGVGAVQVFVRVTAAVRFAEQVSVTVAERLATGSADACDGLPAGVIECEVFPSGFTSTVSVNRLGVTAAANAGLKPQT